MRIDEMPAGREIDALIAEKVMGWRYKEGPKFDYSGPCEWNMILLPPTISDDEYIHWNFPPKGVISKTFFLDKHYSADIAAAWEVVKELKKQRWSFRYSNNAYADTQHAAAFYRRGIGRDILGGDYVYNDNAWAIANTECLAICRAALLAMGVTEL